MNSFPFFKIDSTQSKGEKIRMKKKLSNFLYFSFSLVVNCRNLFIKMWFGITHHHRGTTTTKILKEHDNSDFVTKSHTKNTQTFQSDARYIQIFECIDFIGQVLQNPQPKHTPILQQSCQGS